MKREKLEIGGGDDMVEPEFDKDFEDEFTNACKAVGGEVKRPGPISSYMLRCEPDEGMFQVNKWGRKATVAKGDAGAEIYRVRDIDVREVDGKNIVEIKNEHGDIITWGTEWAE